MEEIPKLHGWITPEYSMEIIKENIEWLDKIGYLKTNPNESMEIVKLCPFLITNAQNVT